MSANARLLIVIDAQDKSKGAFSSTENALKGLGDHSKTAGAAFGSMATQVAAVGAVIGGAVVAGVGKAVSVFADFDKGMSAVKAASGATASEMGQLSAAAIALGQDTQLAGIGASDAALAMEELAKGGVSVADQLGGATKGALLLASAGQISVGEAAGIATKAMNIFSLSGTDVAHVADLMSAGANKSATDVGQLGAAFNQSAAVAKNAGLSIEELTGTLAFLAQRGMEGSDAGTSLKTALLALQAPTKIAAKTMEELGINVRDAQGNMLPFADIADVLRARLKDLSAEQRDAALKTIFGNDAIRVGIALYEGGGGAIRDWTASVNDAGNAARTGAIKNDNLSGSLDQLKAVFETAAIQVGAKFAPAVRTAADELGKFVTKAMASPEVTKALEDLGNKGAAALTKLLAKISDPAFQKQLKEWGTAALAVGKAVASLASDVADVLGPPLKAAVGWFSSLDEQGKKNVIGFLAVAGAAVTFRNELGTLLSVGNSVIDMFVRKAAAKAKLTGANETLAGSASRTAVAMQAVRTAAAAAAPVIADVAVVTAASGVAAVAVTTGFAALANAMDQSGQRALDNTQAWNAASFAIANGGTEANGAVAAFTRLVVATGEVNPSVARLSVLWNQYVGSLQAGGQSTEAVGLHMVNLAQFITGQLAPAFTGINDSTATFNNTLVGLGVGAKTLAASLPTVGFGLAQANSAFAASVTSAQTLNATLSELEATGTVTMRAFTGTANAALAWGQAIAAANAPTVSTAAALSDLNTFGTSAQQSLNAAAGAALSAAMAFDQTNESLARLGQQGGQLGGYLHTLQAEWDALDAATKKSGTTTADQAARYAELAPLIQYLNAQLGVNKDNTVSATEAAVRQLQVVNATSGAYATAAAAASAAASATGQSGSAANAAAQNFFNLKTAVQAVPPALVIKTDANSAVIAAGQMAGLKLAAELVPKTTTTTSTTNAPQAAGQIAGLSAAIALVPRSFTVTATVDISGALANIATLSANMPHSPAKEGPFRHLPDWSAVFDSFAPAIQNAVALVEQFGAAFQGVELDLAKKASETASAVSNAIKGAVDALKALSGLDLAKNTPSAGQMGGVVAFVANTTAMLAEVAAQFSEEALKAAGSFADTASKVVGLIGNGVTSMMALAKYVPPAESAIYAFGKSIRALVNDIALLSEQVTQEAADQAAKFSTAVASVVGILGNGVSGFMALTNYVAPPVAAIYAFGKTLRAVINDLALLAEQVTQESADAAGKLASGAGAAVTLIGNGVAAFMALGSYTAPAVSAIYEFGKTLRAVINDLALVAEQVTQDAVEAAAKFAGSAASVVALIGPAIEGLSSLADFVAPSRAAIDNLANAIFETVRRIGELASSMSQEGVAQAGEFGTAAGSVLSALKTGLDVFTGMAKLVVPSRQAINDFAAGIAATVAQLGTVADQIGKDGIKKASDFGASVQTVFGSLKSSMDILTNLAKFKDEAAKAFTSLQQGLQAAVELAQGMVNQSKDLVLLSEEYAANMLKAATNFAKGQTVGGMGGEEIGKRLGEGVASGARTALDSHSPSQVMAAIGKDVVDGLVQGMSDAQQDAAKKAADVASAVAKAITDTLGAATALGKLDLTTLPGAGQITGILGFTRALVAEMAASATMLDEDGIKQTSLFADAASKVASAVSASVASLTALVTYVAPASRAIFDFGKSLRTAVADLAALADELGVALAEKAATFSEQATKAIAIFGAGASGFTALVGYVRPASKAIYDFGKDLMLALGDLAAIVDEIGQELTDKAGKFGEVAAKAVAVIGGGAESFKKLTDYSRVTKGAIFAFGKDLMMLIADFAAIVDLIGVEVANKAGQFADGAGKAVTVVGTALGSFSGLSTFVTPGRAAVDGLLATVKYIIARFGEMAQTMSTEGTKQLGDFGAATNAVLGGVKSAIDTFILLDKSVVPRTGDLSDLVVAVQGVTRNMATAAAALGDDAIKDATAFGTAAQGIFTALKSGLDLFIAIDKPGGWPTTDWLQPLIELMAGVLLRGGQLLTQSQELKAIADQFSANLMQAGATFGGALGLGEWALTGNLGGGGAGASGGGTTIINNYTVTGNTMLSKDTSTQQQVAGIVTTQQNRTISYATSG